VTKIEVLVQTSMYKHLDKQARVSGLSLSDYIVKASAWYALADKVTPARDGITPATPREGE
jgi:hypothetical protein